MRQYKNKFPIFEKQNKMKLFGASNSLGTAELEEQKRIRKEIEQRWLRMCGTIERVESDESITDLYDSIARNE